MKLVKREKCPFCNSTNQNSLYKIKYNNEKIIKFLVSYYNNRFPLDIVSENYYELKNCLNCSGIFQSFIPDESFSNYLYNYIISSEESLNKKKNNLQLNNKKNLRLSKLIKYFLKKENSEIKILEFGAGWGFWSSFMTSLKFNVETLEIAEDKVKYLNNNNLKNYNKIEDLKLSYDLIFSEEVLEHINDPKNTIFSLSNYLKPGGYMIHLFPSTFMIKFKLKLNYKPNKDCAHPLEHINLFNKKAFKKMIAKTNLKIVEKKYIQKLNIIDNIKIFKNSILFNQVILKKIIK